MRRLALFALCLALTFGVDANFASAQGRGKGGGRGRSAVPRGNGSGRSLLPSTRGGRPSFVPQTPTQRGLGSSPSIAPTRPVQDGVATERPTGRDHALDVQRQNEERKLQQRQQVADHLRANADRNGNQNLYDTADRMEQRAAEHYERRISRINGENLTDPGDAVTDRLGQFQPGNQLRDASRLASGDLADLPDSTPDSLAGRLANEERKLQHQLDVAQQLRDLSAKNGNQNLLQTAERMEDMAYSRYDRQLEKFLNPEAGADTLLDSVEAVAAPSAPN